MLRTKKGYKLKHRTRDVAAALREEPGCRPSQVFCWTRLLANSARTALVSFISAASSWGILWWMSDAAGLEWAAAGPWLGIPGVLLYAGDAS